MFFDHGRLNNYVLCSVYLVIGKGAVYSFDPVGSYQRDTYKAGGSASAMLQPLLDNQVLSQTFVLLQCFNLEMYIQRCILIYQIGFKNMEGVQHVPLTREKAVQLVKDVFISAAERDVYTGDALRICVITKEGVEDQTIPLRKD